MVLLRRLQKNLRSIISLMKKTWGNIDSALTFLFKSSQALIHSTFSGIYSSHCIRPPSNLYYVAFYVFQAACGSIMKNYTCFSFLWCAHTHICIPSVSNLDTSSSLSLLEHNDKFTRAIKTVEWQNKLMWLIKSLTVLNCNIRGKGKFNAWKSKVSPENETKQQNTNTKRTFLYDSV